VLGDEVFLDEAAHEIELDLRGRGKADLDLLEADLHELLEHAQLALHVHGLDQRLVAVAQVRAQPDRCALDYGVGPGTVLQADRLEAGVFAGGLLEHGVDSLVIDRTRSPQNTNGPLRVQTGRWCESLARYRVCP